jgi:molybdopterin synthase catalytic subunit
MVRLEPAPLRPAAELDNFLASLSGEGAVVSFIGLVRPVAVDGEALSALLLDCYPGMTEASLERIAADVRARFPVSAVTVVHRCGDIAPGEPIVFAAAAASHRRAAFEAADCLMDRLKTDAVFWKREDGPAGSAWIEPTEADRAESARWGV